jgi:primosomal replication protein N
MESVPLCVDNSIVLAGQVIRPNETRFSPAGLPIGRFTLEHYSQQWEADRSREVRCRVQVVACGQKLVYQADQLALGIMVRVSGFISRANARYGEARLIVHANQIELLR